MAWATVWILAAAALFLTVGVLLWNRRSSEAAFDPLLVREDWRTPSDAGRAGGAQDGAAVFAANCVACHQTDGQGLPGLYPPLAGSEWVQGSPDRVVRVLLDGLQGVVEVRGAKFQSIMPAFRGLLSDDETAAVLSYVRDSWGNRAAAVAPATVHSIRTRTKGRDGSWTAAELLSIH